MKEYIDDFINHLKESVKIGEITSKQKDKKINNVIIFGLGGSGIGATIIQNLFEPLARVPIVVSKDYKAPNFIDKNTLCIISSYSGNTEETLHALKECEIKESMIHIITSGGELNKISIEKKYHHVVIPAGHPPRAMFGYSFTQLFYVLYNYGIITDEFKKDFKRSIDLLSQEKDNIKTLAKKLANNLYQNTPVIYVDQSFEGIAVRFRQQINENSKMLCWHHVIPEMNHNELLGWRTNTEKLAVVYLRNKLDFHKNQKRIDINKKIISKYTNNITEVWSKGETLIENTLYHIHLGDWTSWYLSVMNKVDAIEIDVIDYLKQKMSDE